MANLDTKISNRAVKQLGYLGGLINKIIFKQWLGDSIKKNGLI